MEGREKMKGQYPPGPGTGFFGIPNVKPFRADPLGFAVKVARDHGDFAFVRLGWVRLYLVNRPELIREVLSTKVKVFPKLRRQMKALHKIEGDGLVVSEGETWSRHRPVVQGSFHARHLKAYADIILEHTKRRIERWTPNTPFDLAEDMNELALEIVAKLVFGVDLAQEATRLREAVHVARAAMQREIGSPIELPSWLPFPWRIKQRRALRELDGLIWDMIHERRRSGATRGDMLGQMLNAASSLRGSKPVSDAEIRDEAATLFVAGHDTTSATMAWFWYNLSQNPEVERRALEEVDTLGNRAPSFEDLPRLKYLELIARESMRLHPASAFLFGREATQNVELGGYSVKKGSWVFIAPYIVHRDARLFKNPETFDPERFAPGRIDEIPSYAYIPFGGGPRICIGNTLAIMEMVLLAATVLQKFRISLDQPRPEMELEVVLRPKGGLRMRALPRTADAAMERERILRHEDWTGGERQAKSA